MNDIHSPALDMPLPLCSLGPQPADALLGLIALYSADARPDKIDLGVGVYRDENGKTPVMRAVKAAEALLFETQTTKSYLGSEGDAVYTILLGQIVFGEIAQKKRITGVQTPGGTGALRLGAELLARGHPDGQVWLGTPTWPNHASIFATVGLKIRNHRFYDHASAGIDFAAMLDDLRGACAGDVLLLHGCCHNPTGASFCPEQWASIADLCEARGLIPFIDLAYQGLGDGLDEDAAATRMIFARLPTVMLAYSCDKNFGLYRERVGALWVQSPSAAITDVVRANMLSLARVLWSMPPDHGAAVVRIILQNDGLYAAWQSELTAMRERINLLRRALAATHPRFCAIANQRGMFAMLPLSQEVVTRLREVDGVYMASNGRINIAGLREETVPALAAALFPHFD